MSVWERVCGFNWWQRCASLGCSRLHGRRRKSPLRITDKGSQSVVGFIVSSVNMELYLWATNKRQPTNPSDSTVLNNELRTHGQ